MLRLSLIPVAAAFALTLSMPADAQRRSAPVSNGVSSAELASTVNELRVANAEMSAQITGLQSDNAALNGKLETLEFLLGQSRDQINDMQGDDAEIGRLIGRVEKTLRSQRSQISSLETKISALETAQRAASAVNTPSATSSSTQQPGEPQMTSRTITRDGGETTIVTTGTPSTGSVTTTSGPTRIVRRPAASEATTTAQPTGSEPQTVTVTGSRQLEGGSALPQGSLGTIPASSLPGEAGPLFAEAKSRLLQFDYAGAETAFRSFLNQFSDDAQAGEAQYWLAEVLYQQEAYPESGQAYTTMIRAYPDDPRAPEALAKLARSMRLVGDTEQACGALNLLPTRYPNASGVTKNLAAGERVRSGCDS
jgi:tol-pal system protein YbgF